MYLTILALLLAQTPHAQACPAQFFKAPLKLFLASRIKAPSFSNQVSFEKQRLFTESSERLNSRDLQSLTSEALVFSDDGRQKLTALVHANPGKFLVFIFKGEVIDALETSRIQALDQITLSESTYLSHHGRSFYQDICPETKSRD